MKGFYPKHHCKIPENGTLEEWIPLIEDVDGEWSWDGCHQYSAPNSNHTISCQNGFEYEPNGFHPTEGTIVMEVSGIETEIS